MLNIHNTKCILYLLGAMRVGPRAGGGIVNWVGGNAKGGGCIKGGGLFSGAWNGGGLLIFGGVWSCTS